MNYIQSLQKDKNIEELNKIDNSKVGVVVVKDREESTIAPKSQYEEGMKIEVSTYIDFPHGLIGLDQYKKFCLEQYKENPVVVLRSTEEDDLLFYLVNPFEVRKDYKLSLQEYDFEILKIKDEKEHMLIFSILTLQQDLQHITCNLLGPILINPNNNIAKQCINSGWGTKHRLDTGEEISV